MRRRCGIGAVLVLALVGLLLAAGPASATYDPAVHMRAAFTGYLEEGTDDPNDANHVTAFTPYCVVTQATGPEGYRFPVYAVCYLELFIDPEHGNNTHNGWIAFIDVDPTTLEWVPGAPFLDNLPDQSHWLWFGTWDGHTNNDRNHIVDLELTGYGDNGELTASVQWRMNDWTNIQMVALMAPVTP
jgi:hypothetical protein